MTKRKQHRRGRPRGKCGKAIYWDEISAKFDLARRQAKDNNEIRVRQCNICFGHVFHLTSQPQRTEKKTGMRDPQSIDAESSRAIA